MATFLARTTSTVAAVSASDEPLGRGGEGSVFGLLSHQMEDLPPAQQLVAKIYHHPSEGDRHRKILAMLASPPEDLSSIAWPLAALYTQDKIFVGYLMRRLGNESYRSWADLSNSATRRKVSPKFSFKYALAASRNLAAAVHSVHLAGHCLGDINESNIFLGNDASVFIVDTDSAQIRAQNNVYRCLVGKPEFTAPELIGGSLKDHDRSVASDTFAYSIAVYNMLTGGAHPTNGKWNDDDSDPPSVTSKIQQGLYPGLTGQTHGHLEPVARIPRLAIPSKIRSLLTRGVSSLPADRPSLLEFVSTYDSVVRTLGHCSFQENHWFDASENSECPLCGHARSGQPDPWAIEAVASQSTVSLPSAVSLPPVDFHDDKQALPQRAAPQRAQAAPSSHGSSPPPPSAGAMGGVSQGQQVPASAPQYPKKIKGKTVLSYADGSHRVRPDLIPLARRQGIGFAWKIFLDELPDFAKPYWPAARPLAQMQGFLLGELFALCFSLVVYWAFALLLKPSRHLHFLQTSDNKYVGLAFGLLALAGPLGLALSIVLDRRRSRRQFGSLDNLKVESLGGTLRRMMVLTIIWLPMVIITLLLGLFYLAFEALAEALKAKRR